MTREVQPHEHPRCERIDGIGALQVLRDELARVAETPGAASSIVQHPDWILFELEKPGASAALRLVVARDEAGRVVGYAPLLAEKGTFRVKLGGRLVPIYRGRALRMLGFLVVAFPPGRASVESAIASAIERDTEIRVIRIIETELPNSFAAALSNGPRGFVRVQSNLLDQVNWTIQPQESLAAYLASLGSKRRNDLSRRLRNIYKKLGEQAHLRIFDAPEHIDEYCRLMNQVYARSWHADEVAIDWELPARRSLFVKFARNDHIVGHMLMLGSRPIAYVHGYRLSGRYLLDDTGYDEEFAALGVGSALVFQAIQNLIECHPADTIDFGYGDNQYKRVLADRHTPCGALYLVRGFWPNACFRLIAPLRWAYHSMRRMQRRPKKSAQAAAVGTD